MKAPTLQLQWRGKSVALFPGLAALECQEQVIQINNFAAEFSEVASNDSTLTDRLPSGRESTTYIDNTIGPANSAYYRIVWP